MSFLLAALLSAPTMIETPPYEKEITEQFRSVTKPASKGPPPGEVWSARVTPPFPVAWPPLVGIVVRRYVYAAGFDPSLHDGERVGGIWATIDLERDEWKVKKIATSFERIGTQGVKPITKEQAELVRSTERSAPLLQNGSIEALRDAYCAWLSYNGVIAGQLRPKHEAFFKALACK